VCECEPRLPVTAHRARPAAISLVGGSSDATSSPQHPAAALLHCSPPPSVRVPLGQTTTRRQTSAHVHTTRTESAPPLPASPQVAMTSAGCCKPGTFLLFFLSFLEQMGSLSSQSEGVVTPVCAHGNARARTPQRHAGSVEGHGQLYVQKRSYYIVFISK